MYKKAARVLQRLQAQKKVRFKGAPPKARARRSGTSEHQLAVAALKKALAERSMKRPKRQQKSMAVESNSKTASTSQGTNISANQQSAAAFNSIDEIRVATSLIAAFKGEQVLSMEQLQNKTPLRLSVEGVVGDIVREFGRQGLLDITRDGRIACLRSRKLRARVAELQRLRGSPKTK
jgi:hypothetical protein